MCKYHFSFVIENKKKSGQADSNVESLRIKRKTQKKEGSRWSEEDTIIPKDTE